MTEEERENFVQKVFRDCDENGDKTVSYQEFQHWSTTNYNDFQKFTGAVNILQ